MCIRICTKHEHKMLKEDWEYAQSELVLCRKAALAHVCPTTPQPTESQMVYPYAVSETEVLPSSFIDKALEALPSKPKRWTMDNEYRLASDEEILKFIEWDLTNGYTYKPESKDCDKFTTRFWSRFNWFLERNNVGFVVDWSGAHAYNVIVRRNGGLWVYEPQDDRWWVPGDEPYEGLYRMANMGILI